MLTIRESAALLGVPVETLRRWDVQGRLSARRVGPRGVRRYARRDVVRLAQLQDARVREAQQVVVDVARAISSSLDLDAVARTIVEAAVRVVGADRCAIYLVNAERSRVDPLWGTDVNDPEAAQRLFFAQPIPIDALPLIGHALQHPEPLVVADTFDHPLSNPELFRHFGTRTLISCGLRGADGRVFAVMPFCWQDQPYAVRDDDVVLAGSLAALAEVALANAQLFAQIEQERAQATAINDVVRAFSSDRDLHETLTRAIERLVEQLGADEGSIWLSNLDASAVVGTVETRVGAISRVDQVLEFAAAPQMALSVQQEEPLLVHFAATVGAERAWFESLGIQASLYVPLVAHGRVIGLAFANFAAAPELPASGLRFASALATQCALAIERQRLLEAESERAAELEAVITQMGEGVIIADGDGCVVLVNDYAARLYGSTDVDVWRAGEHAAFALLRLDGTPFPPDDLPLRRAALEGIATHAEYRVVRRDGSEVFASGSATPIWDSAGNLRGGVLLVRDVTSWRKLEAEKDHFLGVVSHELKTPLTTIKGHTELAARRLARGTDPALILSGLEAVSSQVRRMEGLLVDLLDIQRLETGQLPLQRERHDLVQIAVDASERAQAMTEQHLVDLRLERSGPLYVSVDRSRIDQICDNVLSNAIKYSPDGGTIQIEVSRESGEAVLRFRDQGIGIPEQGRERLFERFYRGSNVRASEYGGLGIGLALSRELALRHGGQLELESTGPSGTTFRLVLPLVASDAVAERGGPA